MGSPLREWPNVYGDLRNNIAEMIRKIIADQEQITKNKVNGEEEMESIAAQTISDLNVILRSVERAGATTDPLNELKNRVDAIKKQPNPAFARM